MPDKEVKKISAGIVPAADSERGSAPEANIPCTSGKENIKKSTVHAVLKAACLLCFLHNER